MWVAALEGANTYMLITYFDTHDMPKWPYFSLSPRDTIEHVYSVTLLVFMYTDSAL